MAPKDQSPADLTLRRYRDLLEKDKVTPEMLDHLGMSKEELNQFVKKFESAPKRDPGAAREIDVKPTNTPGLDPNLNLPAINPGTSVSTSTMRDRGGISRDAARDNVEALRYLPPNELKAGFDAYRNSLQRSKTTAPARRNAAPSAPSPAK